MRHRYDVSLEEEIVNWIDATQPNRSAFIERIIREWRESDKLSYTCKFCSATWYTAFVPKRCISCKKDLVLKDAKS